MGRVIKDSVKKGFSLVELSIVMSVIGLLVGGVLAGQSLLNNQRKNAIIAKANEFRIAVRQFRLKYSYLPGDFPTATQIWGRADGGTPVTANCADPYNDNANPKGTCNGDGNQTVDGIWSGEGVRAWQQLRLAGLINGNYDGLSVYPPVHGVTMPTNTDKKYSMFSIRSGVVDASDWELYAGDYTGAIAYGVDQGSSVNGGGPVLSGEDSYAFDKKIDDGLPASGSVRAFKQDAFYRPNCPAANAYPVSVKDDACALVFMGADIK